MNFHSPLKDDLDPELLNVFFQEAEEITERMQSILSKWEIDRGEFSWLTELCRELHTLKGAANSVRAENIATLAHDLEQLYRSIVEQQLNVPDPFYQHIVIMQQTLTEHVNTYRRLHESRMRHEHPVEMKRMEVFKLPAEEMEHWEMLINEMGMIQSSMTHLLHHIRMEMPGLQPSRYLQQFQTQLETQKQKQKQLQQGMLRTQLTPFSSVIPKLEVLCQHISEALQKQVELVVHHPDIRIHRTILNHLTPSLEHLIRNAIDHGIETEKERLKKGKPTQGQISIELKYVGDELIVMFRDDGGGIDLKRVHEKAIQLGWVTQDENISEQELLHFILQSGFSTKDSVTHISGRGVGLDVVDTEIKNIRGFLQVRTQKEIFTEITLHIPYSEAQNRVLMVGINNERYAVPLSGVHAVVRIEPEDAARLNDTSESFQYGDNVYRLAYLGNILKSTSTGFDLPKTNKGISVLLLRSPLFHVGVVVDALHGTQDVVHHTLSPSLRSLRIFSGAILLEDGHVVLLLDTAVLCERMMFAFKKSSHHLVLKKSQKVLIIDDSETARNSAARLFKDHGYEVFLADHGDKGLEILKEKTPHLILLDLEMPRMDGFEFAAVLQKDERLCNIPIIVISSHSSDTNRQRAHELGVRVFLAKPYQEEDLLRVIEKFKNEPV